MLMIVPTPRIIQLTEYLRSGSFCVDTRRCNFKESPELNAVAAGDFQSKIYILIKVID